MSESPAAGMSAESNAGFDFSQGVPVAEMIQGRPLLGFVDNDAVVLVRDGDETFAVGAHCTHYGGDLVDGIVVNGEIRCPWHHACFSLRTGEAVSPPALNPLKRWTVEEHDGRFFVRHSAVTHVPLAPASVSRRGPRSVVILGGGAAGTSVAETLRSLGYAGSITIIDPDTSAPYDRPNLSKDYLAGTAEADWLPLRPAGFYEQHAIVRRAGTAVAIDVVNKSVKLGSSEELPYDVLVMATGSTPVRPPIPGADQPFVHVLRSLDDCDQLIQASLTARHIVIAGASFIGMEAAASLRHRGLDVTVVAPEMIPFASILGPTIGSALMRDHVARGVRFQMGRKLAAIGDKSVELDDRTHIQADLVLLGIGVRPNVEIAAAAGLSVDRGVIVNEFMETSAPGIYAAGDIARFPDCRSGRMVRIEHWVVAQRQGQVIARNIMNEQVPFVSVPFFWTRQYDTTVSYVGHAEQYSHIDVSGSIKEGSICASFILDDSILAFASIGRDRESLEVERRLEICSLPPGGMSFAGQS